jgi:hypothetical protein
MEAWMGRELSERPLDVGAAMAGEAADRQAGWTKERALAEEAEVLAGLELARRESLRESGSARMTAVGVTGAAAGFAGADAAAGGAAAAEGGRSGARQWGRLRGPGPTRGGAAGREADVPDFQDAIGAYFDALGQNAGQR